MFKDVFLRKMGLTCGQGISQTASLAMLHPSVGLNLVGPSV
jgi:hypothetical protein